MIEENKPLHPEHISACLEKAIRISNHRGRERLQHVDRTGAGRLARLLDCSVEALKKISRRDRATDIRQRR